MHRLRFSVLLAAVIAGLALLAVLGMAAVAYGLLRRMADDDALTRASLASASGAHAMDTAVAELGHAAERLGERAVIGQWVAAGQGAPLAAFLDTFRDASHLTACAVTRGQAVLAFAGPEQLWPALESTAAGAPEGAAAAARLGVAYPAAGDPTLLAIAPVLAAPGHWARTALALDSGLAARLTSESAADLRLLARGAEPPEGEARAMLRERAFTTGATVSERLGNDDRFVAVRPLGGALTGFAIEAALPISDVRGAMAAVARRLAVLAIAVAAAAGLIGLLLGRRLAEPIARLTATATRLGGGDLQTPVAHEPGAELATLAEALDDMRSRLRQQTADLSRQQAESVAVLSGISEGVFSVDRDRRIGYLNPQTAALLGVEPAAALGRFCGDVLRPAPQGGVRPCEEQCPIVHARSRGSARAVEQLTLADGTRRSVVITSSPPAGGLQFQVLRDETETEAARRLRDVVLANISHEFKTPLSAQLASIELLSDQLEQNGDGASLALVQALERGTLRLTQLVDNLLESVRIEAGSHSIRRRELALDEVVEAAAELTAPLLAQRHQHLEVALPYPMPVIVGDGPRLVQALVNLLANANKYAPEGSVIRIGGSLSGHGTGVALWVEDEGPGLPDSTGRSLFGRFVRSAQEDEPEQSGMGLGLWIVQSIVERHGGTVDAERIGERTRIALHLPGAGVGSPA